MAKFRFNLKEANATIDTPILLIVRWNNNRLKYYTGESINPKFWEDDKSRANYQRVIRTKTFPTHPEFNARLDFIETTAKNVFRQYVNDNNQEPTIKTYRELLHMAFNKKAKVKHDLLSFTEAFIASAPQRKTNKVSSATIQAYKQTYLHLEEYKKTTHSQVEFENIDVNFYNGFVKFLTDAKKFAPNTIGKHIKHLKVFIKAATENDRKIPDYTSKFTGMREDTDSIYLDTAELSELFNINLSGNTRLDKTRDLFLLGAYTGLRFSDFSRLNSDNISDNRITIKAQKTGREVKIPLHPTVRTILEKYKGKELPTLSNVKMNEYLKELGNLCASLKKKVPYSETRGGVTTNIKIEKYELLTTHTARRSFSTNAYLDGVPTLTIMAITGHNTEKSFLRYIKITPDEHAKILDLHWQKTASNQNMRIA